jgi:chloride channel 2
MAILTTLLSIAIDLAIKYTIQLKLYLAVDLDLGFVPSFAIWTGFTMFFTMIAASVGEFISKDAEGSGIPEMKSILAGVNIYRYLSFQTVIGKIIGVYSGYAAGLSIGKEGPFVHLAGGITNKLSKLNFFKDIKNNHSLKKQMLAASVAVGVTSSFGAPIGGTLFSIEVTATYYFVNNLWKTFFCA